MWKLKCKIKWPRTQTHSSDSYKSYKRHSISKKTFKKLQIFDFWSIFWTSKFEKEKIKEKKENANNQRELLNNMSNEYQNGTGLEQQVRKVAPEAPPMRQNAKKSSFNLTKCMSTEWRKSNMAAIVAKILVICTSSDEKSEFLFSIRSLLQFRFSLTLFLVSPRLLVWTWTSVNARVQATIKAFGIFRLTYAAVNLSTANRKLSIIIASTRSSGITSRIVAEEAATVLNVTSIIGESSQLLTCFCMVTVCHWPRNMFLITHFLISRPSLSF